MLGAFRLRNNGNPSSAARAFAVERKARGFGMPCLARCCLLLLAMLASPAAAQADRLRPLPDNRPPERLIAARLGERIQFGLGRFGVAERPRLRSHVEPVPRPTDLRRQHRGSAAVGFHLSF